MTYIHRWYSPIVLRVLPSSEPEYVYYAPYYDPRKLPALQVDSMSDLGMRWATWVDDDAAFGKRW